MTGACAGCGHDAAAHAHYRPGTECSACDDCLRYRVAARVNPVVRVLRVLVPVALLAVIGWAAAGWLPHP